MYYLAFCTVAGIIICIIVFLITAPSAAFSEVRPMVTVSQFSNDVWIAVKDAPLAMAVHGKKIEGDAKIYTKDASSATVLLDNHARIVLGSNTEIGLTGDSAYVTKGEAYFDLDGAMYPFTVENRHVRFIITGAQFGIIVNNANNTVQAAVLKGRAFLQYPGHSEKPVLMKEDEVYADRVIYKFDPDAIDAGLAYRFHKPVYVAVSRKVCGQCPQIMDQIRNIGKNISSYTPLTRSAPSFESEGIPYYGSSGAESTGAESTGVKSFGPSTYQSGRNIAYKSKHKKPLVYKSGKKSTTGSKTVRASRSPRPSRDTRTPSAYRKNGVVYLALDHHFGIKVPVRNLYDNKNIGRPYAGTVIDAQKVPYVHDVFSNIRNKEIVTVTYTGNGFVRIKRNATGAAVDIEIKETLPR